MCTTISAGAASFGKVSQTDKTKKAETKPDNPAQEKEIATPAKEKVTVSKSDLGKAVSAIEIIPISENQYKNAKYRTIGVAGNLAFQGMLSRSVNPVGGTLGGIFITVFDFNDAVRKGNDSRVNKVSAALAWATVGIDVANISGNFGAPLVSRPIGLGLDAAGIATSWLSDITANQSVKQSDKKETEAILREAGIIDDHTVVK
jgi:hypothetical protein